MGPHGDVNCPEVLMQWTTKRDRKRCHGYHGSFDAREDGVSKMFFINVCSVHAPLYQTFMWMSEDSLEYSSLPSTMSKTGSHH